MKCTVCKGKSKITLKVHSNESTTSESYEIDCFDCKGSGSITEEQAAFIEHRKNIWCKCEGNHGVTFHPDGNDVCAKHCYTCNRCGKIVQIG